MRNRLKTLLRVCIASSCIILCISLPTFGQWTSNGPFGGNIKQVLKIPGGTIALAGNGILYFSEDQGLHWEERADEINPHLYIDQVAVGQNKLLGYITYSFTAERDLFVSKDWGLTWMPLEVPLEENEGIWDFVGLENQILVLTANNTYYSSDEGATWNKKPLASTTGYKVQIVGNDWFLGGDSLYVSSDLGNSWTLQDLPFTPYGSQQFRKIQQAQNHLLLLHFGDVWTLDPPNNWTHHPSKNSEGFNNIWTQGDSLLLFSRAYQKMGYSTDLGATVEILAKPAETAISTGMVIYPDRSTLMATGHLGLHHSTSPDSEWESRVNGINSMYISDMMVQEDAWYVVGYHTGVYASYNHGQTWLHLNQGIQDKARNYHNLTDIDNQLWLNTPQGFFRYDEILDTWETAIPFSDSSIVPTNLRQYKNTLYGVGFQDSQTALLYIQEPGNEVVTKEVSFQNAIGNAPNFVVLGDTLVLFTGNEVRLSTNGGDQWARLMLPAGRFISYIESVSFQENRLVLSCNRGSYALADGSYEFSVLLTEDYQDYTREFTQRGDTCFVIQTYRDTTGTYHSNVFMVKPGANRPWRISDEGLPKREALFFDLNNSYMFLIMADFGFWHASFEDFFLLTGIDDQAPLVKISEAYPNPYTQSTTIQFTLEKAESVSLRLIDQQGRQVAVPLAQQLFGPGTYQMQLPRPQQGSGIYYYQLHTGAIVESGMLIVE